MTDSDGNEHRITADVCDYCGQTAEVGIVAYDDGTRGQLCRPCLGETALELELRSDESEET